MKIGDRVEYEFATAEDKKRRGTVVGWETHVDGRDPKVRFDHVNGVWPCRVNCLRVLSAVEQLANIT